MNCPSNKTSIGLVALLFLAAGCSKSVDVRTTFPEEPLVEPLPVTVGVLYSDKLTNYTYNESLPADAVDWTFSIGSANRLLFESIFDDAFQRVVTVTGNTASGVDVILEPEIEALEFSLPRQSRNNQYAVWIRYQIKVWGPDGELRTEVPVPGYGEVDSRRLQGDQSMGDATFLAMRDAAAIILESLSRESSLRRAVLGTVNDGGNGKPDETAEPGSSEDPELVEAESLPPETSGQEFTSAS